MISIDECQIERKSNNKLNANSNLPQDQRIFLKLKFILQRLPPT